MANGESVKTEGQGMNVDPVHALLLSINMVTIEQRAIETKAI
jgi:hypothetical protein